MADKYIANDLHPENAQDFEMQHKYFMDTYVGKIAESVTLLKDADKWVFGGSDEYKQMQNNLNKVSETLVNFQPPISAEKMESVKESLGILQESAQTYIKYKNMGGEVNDKARRRMAAASYLVNLCVDMRGEILQMDKNCNRLTAEETGKMQAYEQVEVHWNRYYGPDRFNGDQLGEEIRNDSTWKRYVLRHNTQVDISDVMAKMVLLEQNQMDREHERKTGQIDGDITGDTYEEKLRQKLEAIKKLGAFRQMLQEMTPDKLKEMIMGNGIREEARRLGDAKDNEMQEPGEDRKQQKDNDNSNITFEDSLDALLNENERQTLTDIATELTGDLFKEVQNSIKELNAGDKGLLTGSYRYAKVQDKLKKTAEMLEGIASPVEWESVNTVNRYVSDLKDQVGIYLNYKEEPKNCSGSEKEKQRIAAVKKVRALCEKMQVKAKEMDAAMVRLNKEHVKQNVTEVVNEKYGVEGKAKGQKQLCENICKDNVYAEYIENPENQAVKDTVVRHMAEMVAVEHLGIIDKRQQLVEFAEKNALIEGIGPRPNKNDKMLVAGGVDKHVELIMNQEEFKKAVENLHPNNMCNFVYGNGAKDIAAKIDKKIMQAAASKLKEQQKSGQKQMSNENKMDHQNQKSSEPSKEAAGPKK